MIGTMLKHEAIRTRGFLAAIAGVAAALAVLGALMALTGWPVLAQLGLVLGLVGASGLVPALQLGQAVDCWRSGFGRTGYFTQTLPIRGSRILWTKLLWAGGVLIVALAVSFALALLVLLGGAGQLGLTQAELLAAIRDGIAQALAVAPWLAVVGPVLLVLLAAVNTAILWFAVSVGSEQRFHRLGWGGPLLLWFALYTASQIAMFVMILAVPFGIGVDAAGSIGIQGVDLVQAMVTDSDPQVMPIGWLPVLLLSIPLLLWRTARSWDRKVSLA